jgi:hypothetical protein
MSRSVIELITRLRREEFASAGRGEEEDLEPEISAVLFLDRSVDLVSPMCTPLTYEALVDDIIGIEQSYVVVANEPKEEDEKDIASGKSARRAAKLEAEQSKRLTRPWSCASCSDVNPPPQQGRGGSFSGSFSGSTHSDKGPPTIICRMCGKTLHPVDSSPRALNSNDDLFGKIRDSNISVIQPKLNERARELSEYERSRHDMQGKQVSVKCGALGVTIDWRLCFFEYFFFFEFFIRLVFTDLNEFGRFVKNLSNLQLDKKRLSTHIEIFQSITSITSRRSFVLQWQSEQAMIERGVSDYDLLENAIARELPMLRVLRLMCLQSMCCGGFRKYDEFRREVLQTYGYEYVFTLDNLEKIGLFRKTNIWDWSKVRNAFGLAVENPNVTHPTDMSYVTSGYAPLTCRIVEAHGLGAARKVWKWSESRQQQWIGAKKRIEQEQ